MKAILRFSFLALLLLYTPVLMPVSAQTADTTKDSDLEHGELEGEYDYESPVSDPKRPWTIELWAPANWRTNRNNSATNAQSGLVLEPEWTAIGRWTSGRITYFFEAGLLVSTMMPDASRDISVWWGIAEIILDDPVEKLSPYIAYEPRGVYSGVFAEQLARHDDITLGVRRRWGRTAMDVFLRRRETGTATAEKYQLAGQFQHNVPVGHDMTLNLRGDIEWHGFDNELQGEKRNDIRTRFRTRLFIPLSSSVSLALTADLRRHWSSADRFQFTNLIIGPALSARLRL